MMNDLLLNVAVIAIATALFRLLIPENTFKKQLSFLISCFFLSAVFFSVTNGQFDLDIGSLTKTTNEYVDFSEQLREHTTRTIAEEMRKEVAALLAEKNITAEEIGIIVNISEVGSISISEIRLVLNEEKDLSEAEKTLLESVGDEIAVSVSLKE